MKSGDLVKKFGVSDQTIRRWAGEFEDYLSEQTGRHRVYTADDYIVMATINYLYNDEGLNTNGVRDKLKSGFRVDEDDIATIGYSDGRMVPAAAVEQLVDASEVRVALERMTAERDRLLDQLEQLQSDHKQEKVKLESKIDELQQEVRDLSREIIDLLKEDRNK